MSRSIWPERGCILAAKDDRSILVQDWSGPFPPRTLIEFLAEDHRFRSREARHGSSQSGEHRLDLGVYQNRDHDKEFRIVIVRRAQTTRE